MDADPTAGLGRLGGREFQVDPALPLRAPRSIRERIIGGIILAMPLLITLWIIVWLYSILEHKLIDPLAGLLLWKFKWTTSSTELPYWFETYAAPLIALMLALTLFYFLGLLAGTRLRRAVGWTLRRVPIISHIYNPVQQIFQSLERQSEKPQVQRMVLVTFPHPGVKLPAFVTAT